MVGLGGRAGDGPLRELERAAERVGHDGFIEAYQMGGRTVGAGEIEGGADVLKDDCEASCHRVIKTLGFTRARAFLKRAP